MIPNAHINEGTADNYFFENKLTAEMFEGNDIAVLRTNGHRIRNLASNRDLLKFSMNQLGSDRSGMEVLLSKSHSICLKNKKSIPKRM
jgi:hypothetical protein